MGYSLGFDGGGTKTDCVLLDTNGNVIGEGRGGPANPLRSGYDGAFSSLREAAAGAIAVGEFGRLKSAAFARASRARAAAALCAA